MQEKRFQSFSCIVLSLLYKSNFRWPTQQERGHSIAASLGVKRPQDGSEGDSEKYPEHAGLGPWVLPAKKHFFSLHCKVVAQKAVFSVGNSESPMTRGPNVLSGPCGRAESTKCVCDKSVRTFLRPNTFSGTSYDEFWWMLDAASRKRQVALATEVQWWIPQRWTCLDSQSPASVVGSHFIQSHQ